MPWKSMVSANTKLIRNEKAYFVLKDTTDVSRRHQHHHYYFTMARQKHSKERQDFTRRFADARQLWVEVYKTTTTTKKIRIKIKFKKGLGLSFSRAHQPIVVLLVPSISTVRSVPAVPEYLFKVPFSSPSEIALRLHQIVCCNMALSPVASLKRGRGADSPEIAFHWSLLPSCTAIWYSSWQKK